MKWAPRGFGGDRLSPEYIKKQGWHAEGVLVIQIDDERLTWPERELVRQLGERLYGAKTKQPCSLTHTSAEVTPEVAAALPCRHSSTRDLLPVNGTRQMNQGGE